MSREDHININKVLKGDISSFEFLVDKYKYMVYTIAHGIVRNSEEAEEIAQDTFVKAYQSLSSFKGTSKFSTWLYKITYHLSISELRKKKLTYNSIDEVKIDDIQYQETSEVFFNLDNEERKRCINEAIGKLAEDEQTIITLYYFNEMSVSEIAEITALQKSNVKVKLFRARKKLYVYLKSVLSEEMINFT